MNARIFGGIALGCPFCGGDPWEFFAPGKPQRYAVVCRNPSCHVRPGSRLKSSPEGALAAWNKRAPTVIEGSPWSGWSPNGFVCRDYKDHGRWSHVAGWFVATAEVLAVEGREFAIYSAAGRRGVEITKEGLKTLGVAQ